MQYAVGDAVKLWVNKVGPYNNPQETYNYNTLPFCKPEPDKKLEHRWGGLGEVLGGNELINSQIDIRFRRAHPAVSRACTLHCRMPLVALSEAVCWLLQLRFPSGSCAKIRYQQIQSLPSSRLSKTTTGMSSSWMSCLYGGL